MTSDGTIIAVFYGGLWYKADDGSSKFKDYESEVTEIPHNCTLSQLRDEVYSIINVDRDTCSLKMKFEYVLTSQPCAPQEIRRDKDVSIFIRQVKEKVPITPLYVEILPVNDVDPINHAKCPPFNSGTGSNQYERKHPSSPLGRKMKGKGKLNERDVVITSDVDDQLEEDTQYPESPIYGNFGWETQVQETQFPDVECPEIQHAWQTEEAEKNLSYGEDPEHIPDPEIHVCQTQIGGTEIPKTKLPFRKARQSQGFDTQFPSIPTFNEQPIGMQAIPSPNVPSSHHSANIPNSSQSGSSRYVHIESGSSDDDFHIGQVYDDKKGLKEKLYLYAVINNFEFKVVRSSTTRYEVRCVYESCPWRLRANKIPHSDKLFIIKSYFGDHPTHSHSQTTDGNHRQASSRILGEVIKDKYDGIARVYKPNEIKHDVKLKYGVEISYDKAWRAREHALNSIRGTAEQSFSQLPSYLSMLESRNPGSVTRIATDNEQCFQYCFMALGASIRGFSTSIRPVVAVDGTSLKHRYRGYLYIAAAVDGNGQIYPLAFGVGDSENENAYIWFFQCFKDAYGEPDNLVFVTDRHKAIENALKVVYPNSYHGLCMYHISQNLKAKKLGHEDQVLPVFYLAAKSYLASRFEYFMSELHMINARAVEYLAEIEVERWARCKFPITRYNTLTTNIAECMNAILRDAREMPLIPLLETIRTKLQQWFHDRRIIANDMDTPLTTWTEERLRKRVLIAQRMFVQPINPNEYRVTGNPIEGMVNLNTKSCTCRKFDLDQYPCVHAMAVCLHRRIEFHNMCSHYYLASTHCMAYADSIYPVGPTSQWEVPDDVQRIVRPPDTRRRSVGRPRKNRILSQGEEKMKYKCGRCGNIGHNRARCTQPIIRDDGIGSGT